MWRCGKADKCDPRTPCHHDRLVIDRAACDPNLLRQGAWHLVGASPEFRRSFNLDCGRADRRMALRPASYWKEPADENASFADAFGLSSLRERQVFLTELLGDLSRKPNSWSILSLSAKNNHASKPGIAMIN